MTINSNETDKYPEYIQCSYDEFCKKIGCVAALLLFNLHDEGTGPQTMKRAKKIIREAKKAGCPNNLKYP